MMGVVCLDPGVWLFAVTSDERVTAVLHANVVVGEVGVPYQYYKAYLLLSHSVIMKCFVRQIVIQTHLTFRFTQHQEHFIN